MSASGSLCGASTSWCGQSRGWALVGTWKRFADLYVDPTAHFIHWSRPVGMPGWDKAVHRGKYRMDRRLWVAHPLLSLVEVDFLPLDWTRR